MDPLTFQTTYGREEVERICAEAGTKTTWYDQIAHGHADCGKNLAKRLVEASSRDKDGNPRRPGSYLDLWSLIDAKASRASA